MKISNKFILSTAVLLSFSITTAIAGPVCNINNLSNPSACSAQVTNLTNNDVPYTLTNVNPSVNYNCQIVIEGDNASQLTLENMEAENGAAVTVQNRSETIIPFNVSNSSTSIGLVNFKMHNGRSTILKNESNTVYVICSY